MDSVFSWAILTIFSFGMLLKTIAKLPAKKTKKDYYIITSSADFIVKNQKNKYKY